jgi:hypothetical protein
VQSVCVFGHVSQHNGPSVAQAIVVPSDAFPASIRPGWLFSRRGDLTIVLAPALMTAIAAVMAHANGHGSADYERSYATWLSQFVLGNSTHVILTFLLLFVRRDVLDAAPGQRRSVLGATSATFVLSFAALWLTQRLAPNWSDFALTIAFILATHHTLSQVRGLWSLYNLRGKENGVAPPEAREQQAQRLFVPLGLLLIMVRTVLVAKTETASFPFLQAVPTLEAVLPFGVTWGLVAVWLVYGATLLRAVVPGARRSPAKVFYLCVHLVGVTLTLLWPGWGGTFTSGVHGLEYYWLCARMLRPSDEAESKRLGSWLVWPALAAAMVPLFVVGVVNAPFTYALGVSPGAPAFFMARMALNAVVLAHYAADAFVYRFRIPSVRKVALTRLGFSQ